MTCVDLDAREVAREAFEVCRECRCDVPVPRGHHHEHRELGGRFVVEMFAVEDVGSVQLEAVHAVVGQGGSEGMCPRLSGGEVAPIESPQYEFGQPRQLEGEDIPGALELTHDVQTAPPAVATR